MWKLSLAKMISAAFDCSGSLIELICSTAVFTISLVKSLLGCSAVRYLCAVCFLDKSSLNEAGVRPAFLSLTASTMTVIYRGDRPFQKTLSFGNAYGVLVL